MRPNKTLEPTSAAAALVGSKVLLGDLPVMQPLQELVGNLRAQLTEVDPFAAAMAASAQGSSSGDHGSFAASAASLGRRARAAE